MKTIINKQKLAVLFIAAMLCFSGCDYLDVVPDNKQTIEHAFRNRTEAESYLYGLFGFMPDVGNMYADPALLGGDEIWTIYENGMGFGDVARLLRIAMSEQGTVSPWANYWDSRQSGDVLRGGQALWTAIADINTFIDNLDKPFDLEDYERDVWKGEALFLKAYLHFWLLRMYGPIPIVRETIPLDAEAGTIQRYREPIDEVVEYICELLDEAVELLPPLIEDQALYMGMPDQCIVKALKAQALILAASPLFNCNEDYADLKDARGIQLFPQDKSVEKEKWQRAATALLDAIETAHANNHELYNFRTYYPASTLLSDSTALAMQVRGAATEVWNGEIIWGNPRVNNHTHLQQMSAPTMTAAQDDGQGGRKVYAPTLRIVEQFYTKNGIPIEDDAEWVGRDPMGYAIATEKDRQYIRQGFRTINLHFDREARFYGAIMFDGGTYFGFNRLQQDNTSNPNYMYVTEMKSGYVCGANVAGRYSQTGYLCKKVIHYRTTSPETSTGFQTTSYAFPIIRLADLYLLYSEALNEVKEAPDAEVYEYIDRVRARTGLKPVVEAWREHATADKRSKPATKEGMREIIRRERMNELAFEGARFWDLRRWKLAEEYMNKPVRGLSPFGSTEAEFYKVQEIFPLKFEKKDYLWPIRTGVLLTNQHLVQNPGW
jgi:hypothetical protein